MMVVMASAPTRPRLQLGHGACDGGHVPSSQTSRHLPRACSASGPVRPPAQVVAAAIPQVLNHSGTFLEEGWFHSGAILTLFMYELTSQSLLLGYRARPPLVMFGFKQA